MHVDFLKVLFGFLRSYQQGLKIFIGFLVIMKFPTVTYKKDKSN